LRVSLEDLPYELKNCFFALCNVSGGLWNQEEEVT
jgi:hypothetical protein